MFRPYPKMKASSVEWLGKVPEDWQLFPSKRVFQRKKDLNLGMKCDNRLALTMMGVVPRSLDDLEGLQASEFGTYQIFHKDDLAFKLIDLQNIKTSRVGIVPETGIMSPAYIRCEANKSRVIPKYGYWFFTNLYWQQVYNQLGGGVRQTIGHEELLDLPFLLPSYQEQKAIASFLDRKTALIDELIAKRERQIELLQEHRTALINRTVTKGLNPDVPMMDSGMEWLGEVPEHWVVKKLKLLSERITKGTTPTTMGRDFVETGIRFVKVECISDKLTIIREACTCIDEETDRLLARSRLEQGDVLVAIAGAIGRIAVVDPQSLPANTNQAVGIVRPSDNVVMSKWLAYALSGECSQKQFSLQSVQSAQANLSLEVLGRCMVAVPPVDEQERIASHLDRETVKIDTFVTKVDQSIEKLRKYSQSLISAAVTGKIDVRVWQSSSEPAEETLHA